MATFKIKLEDKAAFESRLKAQNVALETYQIKDNKLKDYFEVDIVDPKQLEITKAILKQSPKINTIKEMKKFTRNELKEMIRQELSDAISEKKKMKDEDKKKKLDEVVTTGAEIEALKMLGSNPTAAAVTLVVTLVLGVLKGPEAIEKLKKMYNYLKAAVPTAAAMFKDAVAKKLGKDIETEA